MKRHIWLAAALLPLVALAADFKYHDVNATVVSVDAATATLTTKSKDGSTSVAPVEGDAVKALTELKTGDMVKLTCKDNDKGEHLAITAIAKTK